jgi:hypothetical protein
MLASLKIDNSGQGSSGGITIRSQKSRHLEVKTLIAVENPTVRTQVRDCLRDYGLNLVTLLSDYEAIETSMAAGDHELLILAEDIGGQPIPPLIHRLRNGLLGPHPFPLVVLLMQPGATVEKIRAAIDSGPDDLLVMPFPMADLESRVARLCEERKPFVVTYRYIGPDRRKQARIDAEPAPVLEAPNPIVMAARGEDFSAAVRTATGRFRDDLRKSGNRMVVSLLREGVMLCRSPDPELPRIEQVAVELTAAMLKLDKGTGEGRNAEVDRAVRGFVEEMARLETVRDTRRARVARLGIIFQRCLDELTPLVGPAVKAC